jgi:hypothetical protein
VIVESPVLVKEHLVDPLVLGVVDQFVPDFRLAVELVVPLVLEMAVQADVLLVHESVAHVVVLPVPEFAVHVVALLVLELAVQVFVPPVHEILYLVVLHVLEDEHLVALFVHKDVCLAVLPVPVPVDFDLLFLGEEQCLVPPVLGIVVLCMVLHRVLRIVVLCMVLHYVLEKEHCFVRHFHEILYVYLLCVLD